jgi:integrase
MKGHLRERGENAWAIILDIGRDPETGRRRQKWHTFHGTTREAQREMRRLLTALDAGTYIEPGKILVKDFLERWLAAYAKAQVSPKTFERYAEIIRCHLIPAIGGLDLAALRPLHLQAYYASAVESGRRPRRGEALDDRARGLAARTVLHHHRVLREALHQAVKWQMLARNPADAVEPPRPVRTEMRALDEAETARLIEASAGGRLYLPILLAATTGLRRGEILAVRWRDIDLEAGTAAVRQSLEQTKAGLSFKEPKTQKGRRVIALPELAIDALRRHKAEQAKIRLMLGPGYEANDLVCCQPDGRPFKPGNITNSFAELVERLKIPHLRFHDLRHGHATLLLRQGVHPKVVSERLGHSTVGITLDVYSHVLPGMQEEAARKVDSALRGALGGRS